MSLLRKSSDAPEWSLEHVTGRTVTEPGTSMRRVQERQVDRKTISSTATPRKFTERADEQDVQGCRWVATEQSSSHPALLRPRVQITSLTPWASSCPLGLRLPFLPLTELCAAIPGRGAMAVADRLGVKLPLGTRSPRAPARGRAHSQQLLVGPLLVRLVADIGDVD